MALNLLFFTRTLTVGGIQINAINLATALVRRGHQITFIADEGPLTDQVRAAGMDFVRMDYMRRRHPSLEVMLMLADQVESREIDVIQAFDPSPLLEAYGSQLWHQQPVYGLVARQSTPAYRLPKSREIALVNPDTRERYIHLLGWPPDRLRLIVARLDCKRYRPLDVSPSMVFGKYGADSSLPMVTLVTRVDRGRWPAIEAFLSAAQHWFETRSEALPAQFVVVGGGPLLPSLKQRIGSLSKSKYLFATGEILDIPRVMNASTLVLGMASTCQQALACGKPVIVLGERGFSAICKPSNFDFLSSYHFNVHQHVDDKQPESLCQQIEQIVSTPILADRLGAFGRKLACERFDSQIGARQLEDVYHRLLVAGTPKLTERIGAWTDFSFSLGSLFAFRLRRRLGKVNHPVPAQFEGEATWLRAR